MKRALIIFLSTFHLLAYEQQETVDSKWPRDLSSSFSSGRSDPSRSPSPLLELNSSHPPECPQRACKGRTPKNFNDLLSTELAHLPPPAFPHPGPLVDLIKTTTELIQPPHDQESKQTGISQAISQYWHLLEQEALLTPHCKRCAEECYAALLMEQAGITNRSQDDETVLQNGNQAFLILHSLWKAHHACVVQLNPSPEINSLSHRMTLCLCSMIQKASALIDSQKERHMKAIIQLIQHYYQDSVGRAYLLSWLQDISGSTQNPHTKQWLINLISSMSITVGEDSFEGGPEEGRTAAN